MKSMIPCYFVIIATLVALVIMNCGWMGILYLFGISLFVIGLVFIWMAIIIKSQYDELKRAERDR